MFGIKTSHLVNKENFDIFMGREGQWEDYGGGWGQKQSTFQNFPRRAGSVETNVFLEVKKAIKSYSITQRTISNFLG